MGSGRNNIPDYLKGKARIVQSAQDGSAQILYVPDGLALQDAGNPGEIFASGGGARCARVSYDQSQCQALFAWVQQSLQGQGNVETGIHQQPWDVTPYASASEGSAGPIPTKVPIGGCVPVGLLTVGHMGVARDHLFSCDPGQTWVVPFSGSAADFSWQMSPKYFWPNDSTNTRTYMTADPASPVTAALTSNAWNKTPTATHLSTVCNTLSPAGILSQADIFTKRGNGSAHFGHGSQATTPLNQVNRKFYGTVRPGELGIYTTRCPIAYNATSVMLVGRPELTMVQRSPVFDPATINPSTGPLPANVAHQLICGSGGEIDVSMGTFVNLAQEIPFVLVYFLGI